MKNLQSHFVAFGLALTVAAGLVSASFTNKTVQDEETRTFSVNGFDRLDMGSSFVIHVKQGSSYSVKATGRKQDLDELDAQVKGKTLDIHYGSKWNRNRKRVTFDITMPSLQGIDFSGASTSDVRGFRNQGNVSVEVSGASTSTIELDADKIDVDFSGASTVNLVGRADQITGDISGATTVKAFDLQSKKVQLEVSGASGVRVNATEKLSIDASGASSVRYRGSASVSANTSGASSVRKDA